MNPKESLTEATVQKLCTLRQSSIDPCKTADFLTTEELLVAIEDGLRGILNLIENNQ